LIDNPLRTDLPEALIKPRKYFKKSTSARLLASNRKPRVKDLKEPLKALKSSNGLPKQPTLVTGTYLGGRERLAQKKELFSEKKLSLTSVLPRLSTSPTEDTNSAHLS